MRQKYSYASFKCALVCKGGHVAVHFMFFVLYLMKKITFVRKKVLETKFSQQSLKYKGALIGKTEETPYIQINSILCEREFNYICKSMAD